MRANFDYRISRLMARSIQWIPLVAMCLILSPAKCQTVLASVGVEKTAKRALYGGTLMFEHRSKVAIGAAYQACISNESYDGKKLSDIFYGVAFQAPIAKSNKIDFFGTVRLGFVNENFFVALPGLETRIKTWRNLSTIFCMGYRVGYPSVGLKLSHPLF